MSAPKPKNLASVLGQKDVFEGSGESRTIHIRPRDESHQPMCLETGRESSVWPWTLQWLMSYLQALLAKVQGPLENTDLESPLCERLFLEVQVSKREVPAPPLEKKIYIGVWTHWEGSKGSSLTFTMSPPSLKAAQIRGKNPSPPVISPVGKRRWCEWAPSFPSYARCCQNPHLSHHIKRIEPWGAG